MKKLAFLLCLSLCACGEDAVIENDTNEATIIRMSIEEPEGDFVNSFTRLVSSGTAKFYFENGDEFGIFPSTSKINGDSQIMFRVSGLSEGETSSSVDIDAGAWATKKGTDEDGNAYTYVSYLPYSLYNTDVNAIPMSFENQIQTANNSCAHLADKALIASLPVTSEGNKFDFKNRYMGSFIRLSIVVPDESKTYTKAVLESSQSDQFALSGTYDLLDSENNQPFTATVTSSTTTLGLNNISVASGEKLVLYLSAKAPIDYRNNTFKVYLYTSDGYYYTYESTFPSVSDTAKQRTHNQGMAVTIPETNYTYTWSDAIENNELGTLTGKVN